MKHVTGSLARTLVAVALIGVAACEGSLVGGGQRNVAAIVPRLMELYGRDDYFDLRAALDSLPDTDEPGVMFLRAVAANAFNDPEASNRALAELGDAVALPDTLRAQAYRLRFRNHMRLGQYAAASEAAEALLALPAVDSVVRRDVENEARAAAALEDAPPQRVVSRGASEIHRLPDTRVPVQVGDSTGRGYVMDTGANFSAMMRSEAEALRLRIRKTDLALGTSTGSEVTADLAVAAVVRIGNVELEHVVFLVVPDAMLTFGPDFRIPGIIGFPVIDALGEVQYVGSGVLRVPGDVPAREPQNLALDYLTPLIEIEAAGRPAMCDFDTGANRTSLHLPFYRRYRPWVEAEGQADTIRTAGAGGERRIPAFVIPDLRVALGDTATTLHDVAVYTESVASTGEHPRDCRLGLDALAGFAGYLLNFRSMTFLPIQDDGAAGG